MIGAPTWINPPKSCEAIENGLKIVTKDKTDFWQRTHYGFRRDDGHILGYKISGNISMKATFEFHGEVIYDQCGVFVRIDEDNWLKGSTEYENETFSHLGSVVTNNGYSDWATQEIPTSVNTITYLIKRDGQDFTLLSSTNGKDFAQMRVCHLFKAEQQIIFGIYGCSPQREGFEFIVKNIEFILPDGKEVIKAPLPE